MLIIAGALSFHVWCYTSGEVVSWLETCDEIGRKGCDYVVQQSGLTFSVMVADVMVQIQVGL